MEHIHWFGHASFYINDKNGNKIYYVDPFDLRGRGKDKADIVFITHAHYDHFSPEDLEQILSEQTIVVAPPDILAKIDISNDRKFEVQPNKSYEVKGFKFSTIPAYNTHPDRLKFHPRENNWVGYIFELNGKKVYHAGDTDFTPEMKDLKSLNLDIALLPIGGTYTMDAKEAAEAANTIEAKITIPMHYKNMNKGREKEVEEEFRGLVTNSEVIILEELN